MKSGNLKNLDRACLAFLVAAVLAGSVWIAATVVAQRRGMQQESDRRVRELRDLTQSDAALKALRQAAGQVREQLDGLDARIPATGAMGLLLKQLDLRMRERRITLVNLQPQAAVPEDRYLKIPIRLVFHGAFFQIYRFLRDMETMDRLLIPDKMTITGSELPPGGCQVDLTVLVFERRAKGAGG